MKRSWSTLSVVLAFVLGILLIPIVAGVIGLLGRLPSESVSAPPGWEESVGGWALDRSLERRTSGLRNPVGANDEAALSAGMSIYGDNCAGCHGGAAGPSRWGSQNFYPRVPQFWQQPEHGEHLTAEEAYAAIHDGIRYSGMGAWRGMLSEQEIWQVANFVSRMHHLPPAVDRQWRAEAQESPAD